jgi:hypothetical protein
LWRLETREKFDTGVPETTGSAWYWSAMNRKIVFGDILKFVVDSVPTRFGGYNTWYKYS